MCGRDGLGCLFYVVVILVACFLASTFLTLLTAELHLLTKDKTLNPFQKTPIMDDGFDYSQYPLKRGVNSVYNKFYSGFKRRCTTFENCTFTVDVHKNPPFNISNHAEKISLYLACDVNNHRCSCEEHWGVVYPWAGSWEVRYIYGNLSCLISKEGPCGKQKGLKISCMSPYTCINDRCRDPTKLNRGLVGGECADDFDCLSHLICERPCPRGPESAYRKRCTKIPKAGQ